MSKTTSKAKKLSRRQMVMLLGSGTVFASASGASSAEAQGSQPCHNVNPLKGGSAPRTMLIADPCCKEGLKIFRKGFSAINDNTIKGHLKDLDVALGDNESQLLEYCVMVWGLDEKRKVALVERLRTEYEMKQIK